jgi:hypothetical protein
LSWFGNDIASPVSRGDRDGVLHALRQSSLFADAMPGNRLSGFVGALQQAGFALMEGRFDDLRRFIGQIDAAGQGCVTWAPEASLGYLFLESWETGKIGRLEQDWLQFFERVIAGFEGRATIGHTCVALIRAFGGSREAALSELDWILGPDFAGREQNESWIYSMHLVADVIEYLETEPHAEVLSSALEPFAEQIACHSSFRWSGGSIASALGLLSSVRGDFEAGEIQFEAGIASEEALGAKPAGLRSRAGLARMLLRRGERDDRPRALALMEEVVKGCERLGIDPRARYVAPFERLSQ